MKIGKVSLNVEAHKGWTLEQFKTAYAGQLNQDIEAVFKEIQTLNGESNEGSDKFGKPSKKP